MKIFKNRYQEFFLKSYFLYFLVDLIIILTIIFIISFGVRKIIENKDKTEILKDEIKKLSEKQNNFYIIKNTNIDFEKTLKILNQLIPEEEDYFSIIYALEILSQKTGFQINSYTVNLSESTANNLKLTITGTGTTESFFNFLKDYNFGGGRLITSDNLSLNPEESKFKIELSFYSKKTINNIDNNYSYFISSNFPKELEKIISKTEFILKESTKEADFVFSYPRKQNPFSFE